MYTIYASSLTGCVRRTNSTIIAVENFVVSIFERIKLWIHTHLIIFLVRLRRIGKSHLNGDVVYLRIIVSFVLISALETHFEAMSSFSQTPLTTQRNEKVVGKSFYTSPCQLKLRLNGYLCVHIYKFAFV